MILVESTSTPGDPYFVENLSTPATGIASLAGGATATLVFDLSGKFQARDFWKDLRFGLVSVVNGTTSSGGTITPRHSADGTATTTWPVMTPNTTSGSVNYTGDLANGVFQIVISGRFLRVTFVNGSTPQGATAALRVVASDA